MNENNVISVLACETVPSKQCIRRGVVYNVEETGANVKNMISMLENVIGRNIAKVYVSVAGQSLHTIPYRTYRQLSSSGIVTENVINQLNDEAQKFKPDLSRKYAIADVEYYVDGKPEKTRWALPVRWLRQNTRCWWDVLIWWRISKKGL